jgi:hypothetical protein
MRVLTASIHIRPWHWLTILSIDAPVVALVWQEFLARSFGAALDPAHRVVLGLSVWLAYVADRWLDGRQMNPRQVVTARHAFAQRFERPTAFVWCLVLAGTIALAGWGLSRREFFSGLLLAGVVFAYLGFCHHRRTAGHGWLKEFAVAALISGGSVLFVFLRCPHVEESHWLGLALFYGLCLLNCFAVSVWDQPVDRQQGQPSLARRFGLDAGHVKLMGIASCALLLGLALVASAASLRGIAVAGGITTSAVVAVMCGAGSLDLETRRLLADATLLSPLLVMWGF